MSTVADAKAALAQIREEMPDASHHVYAYKVGYGNSVIEGMSDDGEPSGTAGPPVLAVVRGSQLGDVLVVVTRYFGGTKLGTGGLVRAYSEAARVGLAATQTILKIEYRTVGLELAYSFYEQIKWLIAEHHGEIIDEEFAGNVTLLVSFPVADVQRFSDSVRELTAGRVVPVDMGAS